MDKKASFTSTGGLISGIVTLVLTLIFIKPLSKSSGIAAGLLGNPIIILLLILVFFLWATKGK